MKVNNDTAIPETPGLNQSLPIQRATTGVVHQLHCLVSLQYCFRILFFLFSSFAFQRFSTAPRSKLSLFKPSHLTRSSYLQIVVRAAYYGAMAGNIDAIDPAHLPHCFDYLRQSIMCASDTTMEWVAAPPNDKGSTGWGYQHTCRDYFAIRQWALDNKWGTSTGIW